MKKFYSKVIEVRKRLGFVYIPSEVLPYFPQGEQPAKVKYS